MILTNISWEAKTASTKIFGMKEKPQKPGQQSQGNSEARKKFLTKKCWLVNGVHLTIDDFGLKTKQL